MDCSKGRVQESHTRVRPRVVAILETMWGDEAGEAARFFRISHQNFSGRRLYKLIGSAASLLVTNACRELVTSARHHGTPNPAWLAENLRYLDAAHHRIQILLVCGKVAQATYKTCGYLADKAAVIEMPHPAARAVWTTTYLDEIAQRIARQVVLCRSM